MLPAGCEVIAAATPKEDGAAALRELAALLDVKREAARPAIAGNATAGESARGARPTGAITATTLAQAVVAVLPEQAIVCDESVSSGRDFFPMSWHAAPHDYLQITGGAIGCGIPLATGAALAAPSRKVLALQADGSAMYTLQGLWTQARERLDVVTVILSNRRYAILHGEYAQVGAGKPGANARRLFDLEDPVLDWVALARGMGVPGERCETAERLTEVLRAALKQPGPFLVEAVM
ncbi:MAG: thiamine pyrophosphate-dependent enzyme [Rubrivivax sp.]